MQLAGAIVACASGPTPAPRPVGYRIESIQRIHTHDAWGGFAATHKSLTSERRPIYVRRVQASQRYLNGGGCSLTWSSGVYVTGRHDTATTCAWSFAPAPG